MEVALHPTLAERLLEWLSGLDSQVVLATHSIDVLRAYAKLAPPDSQLVYLRRMSDDSVEPRTIAPGEVGDIISRGLDPRLVPEL